MVLEMTPTLAAAKAGDPIIVAQLCEAGAEVNRADLKGTTPLHAAVECGNQEMTRTLLMHGASADAADARGRTPLHIAAHNGDDETVRLLLDGGWVSSISPRDQNGATPLWLAAWLGHGDIVDTFLEQDVKSGLIPIFSGMSPFSAACLRGHFAIMNELVETCEPDLDGVDNFGRTGFYQAAAHGHEHIVRYLLRKNVNYKLDWSGTTPLAAAGKINNQVIKEMIARKVAAKAKIKMGGDGGGRGGQRARARTMALLED